MIKYEECDARQRKAYKNFKNAAVDYIYGLENGCFDNEENSQEYQSYLNALQDLEGLIGVVYSEAISTVYTEDGMITGNRYAKAMLQDIRFCGKEFLMQLATQFCEQFQKEVLTDLNKM